MKSLLLAVTLLPGFLAPSAAGARAPDAAADPAAWTAAEVAALVEEAGRRTSVMTGRLFNYAYAETAVEFEPDKAGRGRRERSKVYEVYPVRTGPRRSRWVRVQIAEDGVPLPAGKIAKGRERAIKQVAEDLEEAEREKGKPPRPSPYVGKFASYGIRVEKRGRVGRSVWYINPTDFLIWHAFSAPRRVALNGREAILLDFRPRPGYVFDRTNVRFPEDIEEFGRVMSQLGGRLWIDAADKVIARIEAAPVAELEGARRDDPDAQAPLGFEFTRLPDGTWVPSRSWYDSHGRENAFWKTAAGREHRNAEFKLFTTSAGADRTEVPKEPPR